jgi:hypothetical protein
MKAFRSARWILMALLLSIVPASSYAGVFISVGFAPPALPVYEQPPCPEPGLMWTPGYWAYGPDGYYWVPGAWVPAPYEGALWTPGYWGWSEGFYMWHPGYWGEHVGYYGGVNYGFGYMGVGFVGGLWRGHDFVYNTAVMRVNNTYIHNTYIDRTVVERNTIINDRHVAFSGGPGGIRHDPRPEERMAERDHHMERTSFQTQHVNAAMNDRNSYFKSNGGHPQNLAVSRPLPPENHPAPGVQPHFNQPVNQVYQNRQAQQPQYQPRNNQPENQGYQNRQAQLPQYQPRNNQPENQGYQNRQAQQPQYQPRNNQPENQGYQNRQAQQPQYQPQYNHQEQGRQNFEQRSAPPQQQQYQPRTNYQPQNHPNESRPAPQQHQESQPKPQHESRESKGR